MEWRSEGKGQLNRVGGVVGQTAASMCRQNSCRMMGEMAGGSAGGNRTAIVVDCCHGSRTNDICDDAVAVTAAAAFAAAGRGGLVDRNARHSCPPATKKSGSASPLPRACP